MSQDKVDQLVERDKRIKILERRLLEYKRHPNRLLLLKQHRWVEYLEDRVRELRSNRFINSDNFIGSLMGGLFFIGAPAFFLIDAQDPIRGISGAHAFFVGATSVAIGAYSYHRSVKAANSKLGMIREKDSRSYWSEIIDEVERLKN